MLAYKIKHLPGILLFLSLLLFSNGVKAQDTVSTAGVQFSSTAPAAPEPKPVTVVKQAKPKAEKEASLWAIFLAGIAGGFAALLMPCIFPMLPLTVSYFTKSGEKKGSPVAKAILYGISIIAIYVVMGLLVTVIFGA